MNLAINILQHRTICHILNELNGEVNELALISNALRPMDLCEAQNETSLIKNEIDFPF